MELPADRWSEDLWFLWQGEKDRLNKMIPKDHVLRYHGFPENNMHIDFMLAFLETLKSQGGFLVYGLGNEDGPAVIGSRPLTDKEKAAKTARAAKAREAAEKRKAKKALDELATLARLAKKHGKEVR